jgi:hypothetical protein
MEQLSKALGLKMKTVGNSQKWTYEIENESG